MGILAIAPLVRGPREWLHWQILKAVPPFVEQGWGLCGLAILQKPPFAAVGAVDGESASQEFRQKDASMPYLQKSSQEYSVGLGPEHVDITLKFPNTFQIFVQIATFTKTLCM